MTSEGYVTRMGREIHTDVCWENSEGREIF